MWLFSTAASKPRVSPTSAPGSTRLISHSSCPSNGTGRLTLLSCALGISLMLIHLGSILCTHSAIQVTLRINLLKSPSYSTGKHSSTTRLSLTETGLSNGSKLLKTLKNPFISSVSRTSLPIQRQSSSSCSNSFWAWTTFQVL